MQKSVLPTLFLNQNNSLLNDKILNKLKSFTLSNRPGYEEAKAYEKDNFQ